ncbi:MAG: AAA family ATPase [Deltaproteobacteria bacterium]
MIYLRSVRLDKEELPAGFPFDIPCIRTLESLDFTHPLTFFVGENGCGKSTLLEAIACGMQTPAIGSRCQPGSIPGSPKAACPSLEIHQKHQPQDQTLLQG